MIKINDTIIEDKYFPDRTPILMNVEVFEKDMPVNITWTYKPEELMSFLLLAYHYRKLVDNLTLTIPYFPNARMDRTHSENEVCTLEEFTHIINNIGADKVIIVDPHSQVIEKVVANLDRTAFYTPVKKVIESIIFSNPHVLGTNPIFCFPDKNACNKYLEVFHDDDIQYIYGNKTRNWEDGKIDNLEIVLGNISDIENRSVIIVDDIISYGGTILRCANALKEQGVKHIYAYTTHCEESIYKGKILTKDSPIDKFFTTDSIDIDFRKYETVKPIKIYNIF